MTRLRNVPAPAKLNLFLHVTGRRADGYHLLQTAFRFIDLCDTLHFARRDDGVIQRVTSLADVPSEQCLTVRAAKALQLATGTRWGVDIELDKRIPAGGGLGGGSSDAATVLLALNRLWDTGLSRDELMALALPLGADVPVFVFGENAFAEGVGEALQAVYLPQRWYVVVQPDAHVPTAEVFSAPELTRDSTPVRIADFSSPQGFLQSKTGGENAACGDCAKGGQETATRSDDSGRSGADCASRDFGSGAGSSFGRNDLEPVVFGRYEKVEIARQLVSQVLARIGSGSCNAVRMSGSGACLFIECVSRQLAVSIKAEILATIRTSLVAAHAVRSVQVCAGLDKHPLQHWAV